MDLATLMSGRQEQQGRDMSCVDISCVNVKADPTFLCCQQARRCVFQALFPFPIQEIVPEKVISQDAD